MGGEVGGVKGGEKKREWGDEGAEDREAGHATKNVWVI